MYDSNQFVFKQIKWVKVLFNFFYLETFLPLTVFIIDRNYRTISCWTKGVIGVVMSKSTKFLCIENPNLGKKTTPDKANNFAKKSAY